MTTYEARKKFPFRCYLDRAMKLWIYVHRRPMEKRFLCQVARCLSGHLVCDKQEDVGKKKSHREFLAKLTLGNFTAQSFSHVWVQRMTMRQQKKMCNCAMCKCFMLERWNRETAEAQNVRWRRAAKNKVETKERLNCLGLRAAFPNTCIEKKTTSSARCYGWASGKKVVDKISLHNNQLS